MIIDGRAVATELYREIENAVTHLSGRPHLTVFTCAPNFETKKFLHLKKKKAEEVGIGINVIEFPDDASTEEMRMSVLHALMQTDGVIVQLPFPKHIDIDSILTSIPASYDVDVMQYDGTEDGVLPPVVGAIAEIVKRQDILLASQKVVVVGNGRLVGAPSALWAQKQGAQVSIITKKSKDTKEKIASADVLILGAGQPHFVTPDMIKEGVIIFDAGTSEESGILKGDAHPDCSKKASLFTPVPRGIGPITVAILLKNLVTLASRTQ
ncbi:bifunctional 5,10-methylenetetrahydrofolate dehydrogenase/5,10-methenyltetrahydrofolate cyclohydrolase [Candidatus Pacebacteria bacterium]|nr:bifunctional 5,10-methylenetetrahydrofolate dehydrogenase/5,10-methenyltetrahydrofolate cyclohydrolase [Candidatus Paceibacterota bacterium]